MTLQNILILFALFFLVNFLRERRLQSRLLTAASILFVFALQPLVPIRNFDFWFPFAAIALSLVCWAAVTQSSAENPGLLSVLSAERTDFFLIFGCLLLVALTRLISVEGILTATRPPLLQYSLTAILILAFILIGLQRLEESLKKRIYTLLIILLLLVLILLKTPPLAWRTSAILRSWVGQSTESAAVTDLRWLGFSYIAFRLLSVVIDRSKGRRITASPGVFLTYVLFQQRLPPDRLTGWTISRKNWRSPPKTVPGISRLPVSGSQLVSSKNSFWQIPWRWSHSPLKTPDKSALPLGHG